MEACSSRQTRVSQWARSHTLVDDRRHTAWGNGVRAIEQQRAQHIANGLQTANERLGRKWALESLHALYDAYPGPLRFGDLVRLLGALDEDTVWESTLRRTLDHLRSHRLVTRLPDPAGPPAKSAHRDRGAPHLYMYAITDPGRELVDLLRPIGVWVLEHWPELDAGRDDVDAT
jgi:DNA-binding HxlR family transcriptional regulator